MHSCDKLTGMPVPGAGVLSGALIHVVAWLTGYWIVVWLMAHSPSRDVYGVISGWWMASYIGLWFCIRWRSAILGAACYFVFSWVASYLGGSGYPGLGEPAPRMLDSAVLAMRSLFFFSPVVLNEIGFWIRSRHFS